MVLPDQIGTQANFTALGLWQVPVKARIDQTEDADDTKRQQDEITGKNWIGHEGVEGFVGKIAGVIERVAPLLPRWETAEKHQRRGVKQENRFVRIGGPSKAQRGRPDHPAKTRPARQTIGIGGLNIAFRDRLQSAVKNFARICSSVEEKHDQRPQPCRREGDVCATAGSIAAELENVTMVQENGLWKVDMVHAKPRQAVKIKKVIVPE